MSIKPFLVGFLGILVIGIGGFGIFTWYQPNGPMGLSIDGGSDWYMDVGGRHVAEIQDEDLLYHNLGQSINEVKASDIVVLGPSSVGYDLNPGLLNSFGAEHQDKIYNMAFIAIRGGEFTRQIIDRWQIRPKLWIINVDDQMIHFFSKSTDFTFGPNTVPIAPMFYGRVEGYIMALSRNLRWRMEFLAANWFYNDDSVGQIIVRNVKDGSIDLSRNPRYVALTGNKDLKIERDPNCHITPEAIAIGKDFLHDIGGHVVFILVPHSQCCPQQAKELGAALGIEVIPPPDIKFTTCDGGGHLDRKSAIEYTTYMLGELAKTKAFQETMVEQKAAKP